MIRCWLKLLKDLPRQSHHDAIIFLIISGHLRDWVWHWFYSCLAPPPAYRARPCSGLVSGRACCDTAIGPSWAARRQCPDWTPVTLGPGWLHVHGRFNLPGSWAAGPCLGWALFRSTLVAAGPARASCDTVTWPGWAVRRQCPGWTPVTLGPGPVVCINFFLCSSGALYYDSIPISSVYNTLVLSFYRVHNYSILLS